LQAKTTEPTAGKYPGVIRGKQKKCRGVFQEKAGKMEGEEPRDSDHQETKGARVKKGNRGDSPGKTTGKNGPTKSKRGP